MVVVDILGVREEILGLEVVEADHVVLLDGLEHVSVGLPEVDFRVEVVWPRSPCCCCCPVFLVRTLIVESYGINHPDLEGEAETVFDLLEDRLALSCKVGELMLINHPLPGAVVHRQR